MADLVKTTPLGARADAGVALTWTAADTTTQETSFREGDLLLARNTGAGAHTVTVVSAPSPRSGRTNDITAESIAAGAVRVYGPFTRSGWKRTGSKLQFSADHAEVEFAILTGIN